MKTSVLVGVLLVFLVVDFIILLAILAAVNKRRTENLRQQGLYPPPGKGTDADVRRLIETRQKIDAIKLYREVHGVGLKDAKEAVERMEKCLDPTATP